MKNLWQRIRRSRFLAGVGLVAVAFFATSVTHAALAQTPTTGFPSQLWNAIERQIQQLQSRIVSLEERVRNLENRPIAAVTTLPSSQSPLIAPSPTPSFAPPMAQVVIDQHGGKYVSSFDIYFTGRGFGPQERINITQGSTLVGSANTDVGGNFTSSGVTLPLGVTTFVFTGQSSGITSVATVRGVTNVADP